MGVRYTLPVVLLLVALSGTIRAAEENSEPAITPDSNHYHAWINGLYTNCSPFEGPVSAKVKWTRDVEFSSSFPKAVLDPHGDVLVNEDEHIVCYSTSGDELWRTDVDLGMCDPVLVDKTEHVHGIGRFVADVWKDNLELSPLPDFLPEVRFELDEKHNIVSWDFLKGYSLDPALADDYGLIYHLPPDTVRYGGSSDSFPTGHWPWGGIAVDPGKRLIICSNAGILVKEFDGKWISGRPLWQLANEDLYSLDFVNYEQPEDRWDCFIREYWVTSVTGPWFSPGGNLYLIQDEDLYAVSAAGQVLWRKYICPGGGPAVSPTGELYVFDPMGRLYRIQPMGETELVCELGELLAGEPGYEEWAQHRNDLVIYSGSHVLDSSGVIYFVQHNMVAALTTTGELQWSLSFKDDFVSRPVIDFNHQLIVAGRTGTLYAIGKE